MKWLFGALWLRAVLAAAMIVTSGCARHHYHRTAEELRFEAWVTKFAGALRHDKLLAFEMHGHGSLISETLGRGTIDFAVPGAQFHFNVKDDPRKDAAYVSHYIRVHLPVPPDVWGA